MLRLHIHDFFKLFIIFMYNVVSLVGPCMYFQCCCYSFQPSVYPGDCWAFEGSSGHVLIKVSVPLYDDLLCSPRPTFGTTCKLKYMYVPVCYCWGHITTVTTAHLFDCYTCACMQKQMLLLAINPAVRTFWSDLFLLSLKTGHQCSPGLGSYPVSFYL